MESSRRYLLKDVAELRSVLNINQNTYYPRFSEHPKQVQHSLKRVFCFYCVRFGCASLHRHSALLGNDQ